jgi:hypothetical protein
MGPLHRDLGLLLGCRSLAQSSPGLRQCVEVAKGILAQ